MQKDPSAQKTVHAFVCTRVKEGKESCGAKGSAEMRDRLKKWVKESGLRDRVQVTASLCLDHCEKGISVVIYPDAEWYFHVDKDADYENIQKAILDKLA